MYCALGFSFQIFQNHSEQFRKFLLLALISHLGVSGIDVSLLDVTFQIGVCCLLAEIEAGCTASTTTLAPKFLIPNSLINGKVHGKVHCKERSHLQADFCQAIAGSVGCTIGQKMSISLSTPRTSVCCLSRCWLR